MAEEKQQVGYKKRSIPISMLREKKSMKNHFRSYDDMEREVSQILGFRWYALNDKQYKLTPLNLNVPYYYEGFEEAD